MGGEVQRAYSRGPLGGRMSLNVMKRGGYFFFRFLVSSLFVCLWERGRRGWGGGNKKRKDEPMNHKWVIGYRATSKRGSTQMGLHSSPI